MFYVAYRSQSGNDWFWTLDKTFAKTKERIIRYPSKKIAERALHNASKKHPNKFRNHPLRNCRIVDYDHPEVVFTPQEGSQAPTNYCLGRRISSDDDWKFLTSKGSFASFNNSKKSVFAHLEDCRSKAIIYYQSGEVQLAIFDANQKKLIEKVVIDNSPDKTNEVSQDEVMNAVDVLLRASNYAEQLTQQVSKIDHAEMIDLMHYIELNQLTDQQKIKIIDKIHLIRQDRRRKKDLLAILKAVKENVDVTKIIQEIDQSKVLLGDERHYLYRDTTLKKWLKSLAESSTSEV